MTRRNRWFDGWVLALPLAALIGTPAHWPRWAYMWLVAFAIYAACKLITWKRATPTCVPIGRQLGYLLAWPGMNANRFFDPAAPRPSPPTPLEWASAAANLIAGACLFWGAQRWLPASSPILLGWAGMIGTILMFHFGSFHLLSCAWRSAGVDAPPLMNHPTRSTSLAQFWGRRWNTAFRDLTHQFLFAPLTRVAPPAVALLIGFFVSGLIHDVVISLPARGGYGGPTIFFTVQGAAILLERSSLGKMLHLGRGVPGWIFTALVLLLPVQLLFHHSFVTRVVLPFMQAVGAGNGAGSL